MIISALFSLVTVVLREICRVNSVCGYRMTGMKLYITWAPWRTHAGLLQELRTHLRSAEPGKQLSVQSLGYKTFQNRGFEMRDIGTVGDLVILVVRI